jgi:glycosyltransferase involved in cell wall biosynthesis
LSADWYNARALEPRRAETYLNAVSWDQHRKLAGNPRLIQPIANGVPIKAFEQQYRRRGFALMLSRIAPEKGIHLALQGARAARIPLLIAGELFPYPEHTRYFAEEVAPRLDRERRWIGPVRLAAKCRLLGAARCLIVGSQVPETSSLAAREALAAGTPVVAMRRGALAEVVEHGRSGFLVDAIGDLPEALHRAGALDADLCRRTARHRFDSARMAQRYLDIYERLARRTNSEPANVGAA